MKGLRFRFRRHVCKSRNSLPRLVKSNRVVQSGDKVACSSTLNADPADPAPGRPVRWLPARAAHSDGSVRSAIVSPALRPGQFPPQSVCAPCEAGRLEADKRKAEGLPARCWRFAHREPSTIYLGKRDAKDLNYFYLHSVLANLRLNLLISALIRTQSCKRQTNNKKNNTHKHTHTYAP